MQQMKELKIPDESWKVHWYFSMNGLACVVKQKFPISGEADFEKLQFYISYLIKQGLEYEVKSLKQVPLDLIKFEWYQHFIIGAINSGFKKKNEISFEIRPIVGLGSEEISFLL